MISSNSGSYSSIYSASATEGSGFRGKLRASHTLIGSTKGTRPARRGLKLVVGAVLFMMLFTSFLMAGIDASGTAVAEPSPEERIVVVSGGDTLWSIAGRYSGGEQQLGYAVYLIKQRNQLDSVNIIPGQRLVIPKLDR